MAATETELRKLLSEAVEDGSFPGEDAFTFRHIERIEKFSYVGDYKARFTIERHPHLFGRESLGLVSSAYTPTFFTYEIDVENRKISLVEKVKQKPVINYEMIASEAVGEYWNWGDPAEDGNHFRKMTTKEQVREYAEKRFEELNFSLDHMDLPESFNSKYFPVLKKEFAEEMVQHWVICLKIDEEERQEAIKEKR